MRAVYILVCVGTKVHYDKVENITVQMILVQLSIRPRTWTTHAGTAVHANPELLLEHEPLRRRAQRVQLSARLLGRHCHPDMASNHLALYHGPVIIHDDIDLAVASGNRASRDGKVLDAVDLEVSTSP